MAAAVTHPPLTSVEEDSAKRRQIMAGARQIFMNLGFDGASMGEIARAAGVSKGTLYVYFADKSHLFEAIVEEQKVEQAKAVFNFDPAQDLETSLNNFGRAYVGLLCRPEGGSAIRTVMAIAERMPDVGRRFYENAIASVIKNLAGFLAAKVKSKEVEIDDCYLAAAQFMQMCQATLFQPYIFQVEPAPSPERTESVVNEAVRVFMSAYCPPK